MASRIYIICCETQLGQLGQTLTATVDSHLAEALMEVSEKQPADHETFM